MTKFKIFLEKLKDMLFPRGIVCIKCGKELDEEGRALELCLDCLSSVPLCLDIGDGEVIANTYFDKVYYNVKYEDFARTMVLDYKDGGKNWLYYNMVKLMRVPEEQVDFVTYVPCHKRTIRKRGFDHARELAKHYAEEIGLPFLKALIRVKQGLDASKLTKAQREENIKDSFSVSKDFNTDALKDKTILLVDDLLTTGATASECSKVLKEYGAKSVLVAVFARA